MANLVEATLEGNFEEALSKLERTIQEKVLFSGASAMAKVIADEVRLNVSPPRMGRVTGALSESIYYAFSEERSTETSKTYVVSWNKKAAFYGKFFEFGTSKMAARPFLRPAFSRVNEAIEAGKKNMRKRLAEET
ncbi:MAG: hypothetical protein EOP24_26325 [Hyphomicrobiales bacterium]|nr:MAG: hypothetical protein EOP24_26325 [Hyphomicrobiales bacterium]